MSTVIRRKLSDGTQQQYLFAEMRNEVYYVCKPLQGTQTKLNIHVHTYNWLQMDSNIQARLIQYKPCILLLRSHAAVEFPLSND